MPLVTSQTYVPASSDLIGEIMSAPSGWTVTRPCDNDNDNDDDGGGGGDDDDDGLVLVVVIVVVMVMLGVPLGSADFMHDFNLETKHSFKIKTENVPR